MNKVSIWKILYYNFFNVKDFIFQKFVFKIFDEIAENQDIYRKKSETKNLYFLTRKISYFQTISAKCIFWQIKNCKNSRFIYAERRLLKKNETNNSNLFSFKNFLYFIRISLKYISC